MNKITFTPKSKEAEILVDHPIPYRKNMPEWYKNMPAFSEGEMKVFSGGSTNATAKLCRPFFDSLSMGYVQNLWCDVYIKKDGDQIFYENSMQKCPAMSHREDDSEIPINSIFFQKEFIWKMQWVPKLPKGYSMIYTHPFNREDLPFRSFTGIVDSDVFFHEKEANHPFYIQGNFEGLIPAGTPIVQMIPFKREEWKMSIKNFSESFEIESNIISKHFFNRYKKLFWNKKVFT
jgi:hypothetical protein